MKLDKSDSDVIYFDLEDLSSIQRKLREAKEFKKKSHSLIVSDCAGGQRQEGLGSGASPAPRAVTLSR